jgi:hypothetical protein
MAAKLALQLKVLSLLFPPEWVSHTLLHQLLMQIIKDYALYVE